MAGTPHGRVNTFHPNTGTNGRHESAQELFKNLHDHLLAQSGVTRKALYYGTGGAVGDGAGVEFWDQANSFATGAFAVFTFGVSASRTWTFDVLIQWAGNAAITGNGLPVQMDGGNSSTSSGEVAISVAVGIGGDGDPWNGTTNNDGTDSKGSPVWATPSGGTHVAVLPDSNRDGGGDGTNKENMAEVFSNNGNTTIRFHILTDEDNLAIVYDSNAAGTITKVTQIGIFTPDPDMVISHPLFMLVSSGEALEEPITEQSDVRNGVVGPDSNFGVRVTLPIEWEGSAFIRDPAMNPGTITGTHKEGRLAVAASGAFQERLGLVDPFFSHTYNLTGYNMNADLSRAFWAHTSAGNDALGTPWANGAGAPGTGTDRTGVTF